MHRLFTLLFCTFALLFSGLTETSLGAEIPVVGQAQNAGPVAGASESEEGQQANGDDESEETANAEQEGDADASAKDKEAATAAESENSEEKSDEKEAKGDDKSEEDPASKAHEATTKDLTIETTLDGVFVAEEMEEVAVRPEIWSTFKVVEAVEHGTKVKKGDVVVRFDDAKFEEALAEKSLQQRLDELEMMEAEEEFPRYEEAMELAWQNAKRERQEYLDEYERFREVMRPLSEKLAESNLKNAKQSLENAREELEQLEKMYEADELTEETEEIVLKRQRHMVEYYELNVEYAEVNHEYMMDVILPRREELLTTGLKSSELEFDRAKMQKSLGLSKKRYEMEKLRAARARSVEQHAKLVEDRSLLTLRAPIDGIVYYGANVNGRFSQISSLSNKLIPFGSISPNTVVMTVVKSRPLGVLATVSEKSFADLEAGQKAEIVPVADDEIELPGEIEELASAPGASNKFDVELDLDADDAPDWLMPGMTCKVKVTTYEAEDAIVIPADLVYEDEESEESYVMLLAEGEKEAERRTVEVGQKKDKEVEILEGLEKGDKIVKKDDAKETKKSDDSKKS